MSDHELLQRYARTGDQAAFTELVARHLNLVYSAAHRQVRPPQLAEEVAQSVFLDLARRARDFPSGQPLAPWLHVVTRRTAVDAIRRESRRQAREQTALEIAAMQTPNSNWSHIAPLLDEAVAALPDADRTALVLRFFEQKSLREIGTALGTNEDAAQKRVSRALDQLRTLLNRRGLTVTAAGLATDLSAHAILTVPATLGATISASVIATLPAAALAGAHTLAMTTLQKTILAAAALTSAGTAFQIHALHAQRDELANLRQSSEQRDSRFRVARDQIAIARQRTDEADARLAAHAQSTQKKPADLAAESAITAWLEKIGRLRQLSRDHPELTVPEIARLSENDWMTFAQNTRPGTEGDTPGVMSGLRFVAESSFIKELQAALTSYLTANAGVLPENTRQLAPHFKGPLDPAVLDRYKMISRGKAADLTPAQRSRQLIEQRSPLDLERDQNWTIGLTNLNVRRALADLVEEASRDYAAANNGTRPVAASQLAPYLKRPVNPQKLQPFLTPAR
jgi:RNA polymerase sigma factor (sigma-70 family)